MSDIKTVIDKLEKLDGRIDGIDITLTRQNASLEHHIKRSDQLDSALSIVENRLNPIEDHILKVYTTINTITGIGSILGAIGGVILFFIAIFQFLVPLFHS